MTKDLLQLLRNRYTAKPTYWSTLEADMQAAMDAIERLQTALSHIRDGQIIQGMSPALFAEKVLEGTADEPGAGPMPWNPETSTNISIHEQTPEKPSGVREPIFGEVGCAHCGAPYATAHNPGCVLYMASEKSGESL